MQNHEYNLKNSVDGQDYVAHPIDQCHDSQPVPIGIIDASLLTKDLKHAHYP
jgi:hypothetical protein